MECTAWVTTVNSTVFAYLKGKRVDLKSPHKNKKFYNHVW